MATGFSVVDALSKNSKQGIEETPRARFRTKDISIHKIYSNSKNFYPQEGIKEKAAEILAVGMLENIAVMYAPEEQGEYRIISGERRWRALKMLVEQGYKEFEIVTCQVRSPANPHEEKIELIIANSSRVKDTATLLREEAELKEELEYMRENGIKIRGYDLESGRLRDVIAGMLKMSKTKIAQIEAVNNNLIPELREAMEQKHITFSAAYELAGMAEAEQREALEKYMEDGKLSYKSIKEMKQEMDAACQKEQMPEQKTIDHNSDANEMDVSDSDTDGLDDDEEEAAAQELIPEPYEDPHPIGITSLCYGCQRYLECNVRTSTCTSCDQYVDKAEAEKTDEQRYDEEQDRIDRQTRARLREIEDEEKMKRLPSEEKKREAVIEFLSACDAICTGRHCDMYGFDSPLRCPLYKWCDGTIFPMGEKKIREFVDAVEREK